MRFRYFHRRFVLGSLRDRVWPEDIKWWWFDPHTGGSNWGGWAGLPRYLQQHHQAPLMQLLKARIGRGEGALTIYYLPSVPTPLVASSWLTATATFIRYPPSRFCCNVLQGGRSAKTSLVVIAMFKGDCHIYREWVDHYLSEGVRHLIILDNNHNNNSSSQVGGERCPSIRTHGRS